MEVEVEVEVAAVQHSTRTRHMALTTTRRRHASPSSGTTTTNLRVAARARCMTCRADSCLSVYGRMHAGDATGATNDLVVSCVRPEEGEGWREDRESRFMSLSDVCWKKGGRSSLRVMAAAVEVSTWAI